MMKARELKEKTEMLKRTTASRKEAIATAFYVNAKARGMISDVNELREKEPFCNMLLSNWAVKEDAEDCMMEVTEFALLPELLMSKNARSRNGAHYTDREAIKKTIKPIFRADADVLDPACGGGCFLLVLHEMGVPTSKLHGIEIDKVAAAACEGAILLSEWDNGEELCLPDIVVADALTFNWNVIKADAIVGNPPYLGSRRLSTDQKQAMKVLGADAGLDLCAGWLIKADMYIRTHPEAKACFICTDSIAQGSQIEPLWQAMHSSEVFYACRDVDWKSCGSDANVSCCIIGLSAKGAVADKIAESKDGMEICDHINGYLMAGDEFHLIPGSPDSLHKAMHHGSVVADRKNLVLDREERDWLIAEYPETAQYIRRFLSAESVMGGKERWCLWLSDAPEEVLAIPCIADRLEAVRRARQNSKMYKHLPANMPYTSKVGKPGLFLPRLSSAMREYLPVFTYSSDDVPDESLIIIPEGELWEMSILSSRLFKEWVWLTSGRYSKKSRLSASLSWYTFPIPELTDADKEALKASAEKIISARENISLTPAQMYNKNSMSDGLKEVLEKNSTLVERVLNMSTLEEVCNRYQELSSPLR